MSRNRNDPPQWKRELLRGIDRLARMPGALRVFRKHVRAVAQALADERTEGKGSKPRELLGPGPALSIPEKFFLLAAFHDAVRESERFPAIMPEEWQDDAMRQVEHQGEPTEWFRTPEYAACMMYLFHVGECANQSDKKLRPAVLQRYLEDLSAELSQTIQDEPGPAGDVPTQAAGEGGEDVSASDGERRPAAEDHPEPSGELFFLTARFAVSELGDDALGLYGTPPPTHEPDSHVFYETDSQPLAQRLLELLQHSAKVNPLAPVFNLVTVPDSDWKQRVLFRSHITDLDGTIRRGDWDPGVFGRGGSIAERREVLLVALRFGAYRYEPLIEAEFAEGGGPADPETLACSLLTDIAGQKLRFLDYLKEADQDPTLSKVAHCVAHIAVRELASDLSLLGLSEAANEFLQQRESIDIGGMLVLLDRAACVTTDCYPDAEAEPPEGAEYKTLAEIRADLLVRTMCDEEGKPIFTEADIPALIQKSPASLDRLYTKAAELNQIPCGEGDAASLPQKQEQQMQGKAAEDADAERPRCAPMMRTEIARRLLNKQSARLREARGMMERHGLRHEDGKLYTICLDKLDSETRARMLKIVP